jgi:peptide deformylase
MNLMLGFLFACVVVGLAARRLGVREQVLVAALAATVTALYYLFGERFY